MGRVRAEKEFRMHTSHRALSSVTIPSKKKAWVRPVALTVLCLACASAAALGVDALRQRQAVGPFIEPVPADPAAWFAQKMRADTRAPDFTASRVTDGTEVRLSDFRGGKPVVLIFGSLSCDRLCAQAEELERLYRAYRDRADFLFVYIREAHGRGAVVPIHSRAAMQKAMAEHNLSIPCVRDSGAAEGAYDAWPKRLVVVGPDGRIVLDAGRGMPERWDLEEVEAWLRSHTSPVPERAKKASAGQGDPPGQEHRPVPPV
jgi:peroxiredoxin